MLLQIGSGTLAVCLDNKTKLGKPNEQHSATLTGLQHDRAIMLSLQKGSHCSTVCIILGMSLGHARAAQATVPAGSYYQLQAKVSLSQRVPEPGDACMLQIVRGVCAYPSLVCRPGLLHTCHACFLQIVTGLERFLRLVDPSVSSSQVPPAVASSKDSHGEGGEGPLFQLRCAWPGQSQLEELGSLEGLLQAAFKGQRGDDSGGAPARSESMHWTQMGLQPQWQNHEGLEIISHAVFQGHRLRPRAEGDPLKESHLQFGCDV